MRGALRATLLALAVTLVSADYLYEHLDVSPRAFSRRSRYAVNMCESCGPNQCHVMGKCLAIIQYNQTGDERLKTNFEHPFRHATLRRALL